MTSMSIKPNVITCTMYHIIYIYIYIIEQDDV